MTDNWLESCYIAYNNSGFMYEKYNALEKGVGGGGGMAILLSFASDSNSFVCVFVCLCVCDSECARGVRSTSWIRVVEWRRSHASQQVIMMQIKC